MKRVKKLYKLAIFSLVLLLSASCHEFLEINEDPNNPLEVPLELLLPSIEADMAGALSPVSGGLSGITMAYTHQTTQRGTDWNDYGFSGTDFQVLVPWDIFYTRALKDIDVMIDLAQQEGSSHYEGIGLILQAYIYSVIVDIWADAPFSEALQGTDNPFPRYDQGEDIYPQLFVMLDRGIDKLEEESLASPSDDDIFYGGDLDSWRKLAKTIKLKLYNQVRLVQNVSSQVNALIAEGDLLEEGEDFEFPFGTSNTPDDRNPSFVEEYGGGSPRNYMNPLMYEYMANLNTFQHRNYGGEVGEVDPRIPYYFYNQIASIPDEESENPCSYCYGYTDPNDNFVVQVPELENTGVVAIYSFSFNIDPNEGFDQAVSQTMMGLYPIGGKFDDGEGGAASPTDGLAGGGSQRILTYFARKYIEAELFVTGVASGDARAAFEEALNASFDKVNEVAAAAGVEEMDTAAVNPYIRGVLEAFDNADDEGKLEHIITQKWLASFGFGVDSYNDYRRTGFPVLHDGNTDNIPYTVRSRNFPNSFPWVTQNLQTNRNSPNQKNVVSPAAKVFWMP